MDKIRIKQLLHLYFSNTIHRKDCEWLLRFMEDADESLVHRLIDEVLQTDFKEVSFPGERREQVYNQLRTSIQHVEREGSDARPSPGPSTYRKGDWFRMAAVLFCLLTIGLVTVWFVAGRKENGPPGSVAETPIANDILLPNQEHAILTLANGETILVDSSMEETLVHESGIKLKRNADGSIQYHVVGTKKAQSSTAQAYNTFSTPKGHSYQIVLPDGSRVWLNTASTLRFPVDFDASERKVLLSGEAYFEITNKPSQPFRVEANGTTVQVLGTHFNISAYDDEDRVTTTLLEGKVNVLAKDKTIRLKPGQQSIAHVKNGYMEQKEADIRSIMAWKNGHFRFENEPIEQIMDKISRWYDIEEISYEGLPDDRFTGTFQRSKSVMQLFENLEKMAAVKFEIRERRIKVIKK